MAKRTSKRVRSIASSASKASRCRANSAAACRRARPSACAAARYRSRARACSRSSSTRRSSTRSSSVSSWRSASRLRNDIAKRRAIFPLEPLEQRQPVFDLLEPCRRGFDVVSVAPQKEREILELRLDSVARLEIRLERRIQRGELCHPPPDAAEVRQRGPVALIQQRVAFRAQPPDALGAREHLPGRRQLDVFSRLPWLEGRSIELTELKDRELMPRGAIRRRAPDVPERLDRRSKRGERLAQRLDQRAKRAERVENRQMGRGIEQGLVLVLPVQLDQTPGQILERAGRGERAVDEGAAASLGRDFAANQQLLPAAVENRFDGRRVLPRSHEVARRSSRRAAGRWLRRESTCRRRSHPSGR